MDIDIITRNLQLDIVGYGTVARNKDYAGTAFGLSRKTWEIIKANELKKKGKKIWISEEGDKVFEGVEGEDHKGGNIYGLEEKKLSLEKYAYYKHIGSYKLIGQAGQTMASELKKQGFEVILPYVEIYGHWTKDENKLETELFMSLK